LPQFAENQPFLLSIAGAHLSLTRYLSIVYIALSTCCFVASNMHRTRSLVPWGTFGNPNR